MAIKYPAYKKKKEVEPVFNIVMEELKEKSTESWEDCDRCFASEEYQSIMELRTESVRDSAIIVEGIEDYKP